MIKKILVMSLLIVSIGSYAQNKKGNNGSSSVEKHDALPNTFEKGQLDINLGLGLGVNRYYYTRGWTVSPPINVSIDKGITSNISLGGYLAYVRSVYRNSGYYTYYDNNTKLWMYDVPYNDKRVLTYGVFGIRGAFHFCEFIQVENLDLYGGAMLGYSFAKYKYTTDNSNGRTDSYYSSAGYGGAVASLYAGGRYRFTDKFGVYAEFGFGLSYGNFGVNFKF